MDALTLKAAAAELNTLLTREKIEKIYQPTKDEIVLKVGRNCLLLSCHPVYFSMHISKASFDNPATPSAFAMILRKHLSKGKISSITMDGFERVVTITIENSDELFNPVTFRLMVELMGKHSNIILVDETGKILDSIKRIPLSISRLRQVLPGTTYSLPPKKDDIPENLSNDYQIKTGLYPFTKDQLTKGVITINDCIDSIENPHPNILKNDKKSLPLSLKIPGYPSTSFDTMSQMLDYFYSSRDTGIQNADLIKNISTTLSRLNRSLDLHRRNQAASGEKYKLYGELLTSYSHQLKQGKSVAVLNYYTNEEITIPLNEMLTINENAQKYYKRYNKIKAAKIHALEQIEILSSQIEYLENTLVFLNNSASQKDVTAIKEELAQNGFFKKSKKKVKPQKLDPIKYTSSTGFKIEVGRNSMQNDELTTKKAKGTDLWFHVKDIPGSHVIVYTDGKAVDNQTLLEACSIAAYHSKGKDSSNVPVDYTLIKHVKKPAHALPGKVIYTDQKTVFITPDLEFISKLKK